MSREGQETDDIDKNDHQDEEDDEEEEDDEDFSFESSLEEEEEQMMIREDYDIDMVIDLPSLEQLENSYTKDEKGYMRREIDLANKDENDEETMMKNKLMLNSKGYKKDSFIDNESEEERVVNLQNSNPYKDYYVNEDDLIEDKQTKKEKRKIKSAQENIIRQHKINNTVIPPMGDDFKPELKKAVILLKEKTKEIFSREKPPRNFPAELDPYLLEVGKLAIDTNEKKHITHKVMEQLSFFPFASSTITKRIKDVIKKDNTKNSQTLGEQKSPVVERRSPSPPSRGSTPLGLDAIKEKSPPLEVVSKSKKRKIETVEDPIEKKNSKVPKPPSPKKPAPVKDSPLNKSMAEVMEDLELTKEIKEDIYEFKSMVQESYKNPKNAELKWDDEEFIKITDKKVAASMLEKCARNYIWTEDITNKIMEVNNKGRE
eukprot:TRINITY_DN13739_c0_g1_i1.p1 TRINITY_DN13739_c0_g1~~TRINITY_DN13739_c0_g1_i1.p1  ORF type:complete len:430 (-),score=160.44 TRINITY_DN13739_c0_g1_i1:64-1353(-)